MSALHSPSALCAFVLDRVKPTLGYHHFLFGLLQCSLHGVMLEDHLEAITGTNCSFKFVIAVRYYGHDMPLSLQLYFRNKSEYPKTLCVERGGGGDGILYIPQLLDEGLEEMHRRSFTMVVSSLRTSSPQVHCSLLSVSFIRHIHNYIQF